MTEIKREKIYRKSKKTETETEPETATESRRKIHSARFFVTNKR